jgi:succinate dehydrogenase / fumarate reductase cytochrome b subunit
MPNSHRPLTPHLTIYKWPLTAVLSISHRLTGVFLLLGLVVFFTVLVALASGEAVFLSVQHFLNQGSAQMVLAGFAFALSFHLVHGLRHLLWDLGLGFESSKLGVYALWELLAISVVTGVALVLI